MPRVGQILTSKKGVSYIKIDDKLTENLVLEPGQALFLSNPADDVDGLVSIGKLTAEEGEARKARIPSFVKKNISIANKKD